MLIFIIPSALFVFIHLPTDDARKGYIDDIYLEINRRGLK